MFQKLRLKALHHLGGLPGVAAGTDAQVNVRLRQLEILEENFGHVGVIMLPGMHQYGLKGSGVLFHLFVDGGDLHKIRSCPDDIQDFELHAHLFIIGFIVQASA